MQTRRIGDISIDSAIGYLKNNSITEDHAAALVELTGGRFQLLEQVLISFQRGLTIEGKVQQFLRSVSHKILEIKTKMVSTVRPAFSSLSLALFPTMTDQAKKVWRMLEYIHDKEAVLNEVFEWWLGTELTKALLKRNICAADLDTSLITFQSPLVKYYVRLIIGVQGSQTRAEFTDVLGDTEAVDKLAASTASKYESN